jgi:predicted MPP superfamily phosphohydrolase
MRRRIFFFISVIQSIIFLGHGFVYSTWRAFLGAPIRPAFLPLGGAFAFLSITFVTASLLSRRYSNRAVRSYYAASAVWLGFLSFFFLASCGCWLVLIVARLAGMPWGRSDIAITLFALGGLAGVYGLLNASRTRVRRITVHLKHLPPFWDGRVAALVTDMHLGHVRGVGFARRIVAMVAGLAPDVVLIGGDMFDGTNDDLNALAQPWKQLAIPFGTFFVGGNHEEFAGLPKCLEAVANADIRVLNNEKVVLNGLQLVGAHYHESSDPIQLRAILKRANLDPACASLLLAHAPNQLAVAEESSISLQLSGHTHGGQFFPFTLIVARIYGRFTYGLNRLERIQVYTSYGAGTWGPPMRVGTSPEIVLIEFR